MEIPLRPSLMVEPIPDETNRLAASSLEMELGRKDVAEIRQYRAILVSGLRRWLTYDRSTERELSNDTAYKEQLAYRHNNPSLSEAQAIAHRVKTGARELYVYAGQVSRYKALTVSNIAFVPEQQQDDSDLNRSA